jgi:enoyl-CoA hydratase
MAPSHLQVEHSPAGYRRLLLSRPERRNALDVGLAQALRDALGQDRATPVVLGSADPRVFCAGADLRIPDADRATVSDLLYECYEIMITRQANRSAWAQAAAPAGGWAPAEGKE